MWAGFAEKYSTKKFRFYSGKKKKKIGKITNNLCYQRNF